MVDAGDADRQPKPPEKPTVSASDAPKAGDPVTPLSTRGVGPGAADAPNAGVQATPPDQTAKATGKDSAAVKAELDDDPKLARAAKLERADRAEQNGLRGRSIESSVAEALDKDVRSLGDPFRRRVESAASAVGLDPGFLAACIFREIGTDNMTNARRALLADHEHGVDSGYLGLDDLVENLPRLKNQMPALRAIHLGAETGTFSPEHTTSGRDKPTVSIPGDQAVLAFAGYLKGKENTIRSMLEARGGPNFDDLQADKRFFLARLAMNPGHESAGRQNLRRAMDSLKRDEDPMRHGISDPDSRQRDPVRGATLAAVQGVHLSRVFFGRNPYEDSAPVRAR